MRTNKPQYVIDPPNIPEFLYRHNSYAWRQLVAWAKNEFQARLVYLAEHGYWKELRYMNDNESPVTILAEMHGYRKLCAIMSDRVWDCFTARERSFVRKAYDLRDLLLRQV